MNELKPCPFCGGEAMSMLGEQIKELREAARNIQGNLGRCVYRRKDVDEMQQVSGMLFEAADTITSLWNSRVERTCELVETDRYTNSRETIHVLECSECGETCEHVNGIYPRCPHCGAKVVGE